MTKSDKLLKEAADTAGWRLYQALSQRGKDGHKSTLYGSSLTSPKVRLWLSEYVYEIPWMEKLLDDVSMDLFVKRAKRHAKKNLATYLRKDPMVMAKILQRLKDNGPVVLSPHDDIDRVALHFLEENGFVNASGGERVTIDLSDKARSRFSS